MEPIRPMPVEIPNSEFDLEFDTVIPAIGQDAEFDFIENKLIGKETKGYETKFKMFLLVVMQKEGVRPSSMPLPMEEKQQN